MWCGILILKYPNEFQVDENISKTKKIINYLIKYSIYVKFNEIKTINNSFVWKTIFTVMWTKIKINNINVFNIYYGQIIIRLVIKFILDIIFMKLYFY